MVHQNAPAAANDGEAIADDDSGMSQGSQEGMDVDMMGTVGAASPQRNRGWNRRASKKKTTTSKRYEATELAAATNRILEAVTVNCIALEKSIAAKEAEIERLAACSRTCKNDAYP